MNPNINEARRAATLARVLARNAASRKATNRTLNKIAPLIVEPVATPTPKPAPTTAQVAAAKLELVTRWRWLAAHKAQLMGNRRLTAAEYYLRNTLVTDLPSQTPDLNAPEGSNVLEWKIFAHAVAECISAHAKASTSL